MGPRRQIRHINLQLTQREGIPGNIGWGWRENIALIKRRRGWLALVEISATYDTVWVHTAIRYNACLPSTGTLAPYAPCQTARPATSRCPTFLHLNNYFISISQKKK